MEKQKNPKVFSYLPYLFAVLVLLYLKILLGERLEGLSQVLVFFIVPLCVALGAATVRKRPVTYIVVIYFLIAIIMASSL